MQYSVMQRAMASGHRLTEVLDVDIDIQDSENAFPLGKNNDGAVEFRNVNFGYDPLYPVLKSLSFRINPG